MISKDKLEKLNGLSPEEYQAAVTILKQYAENVESELFDELKYSDFEEIPVDIDTFLDDDDQTRGDPSRHRGKTGIGVVFDDGEDGAASNDQRGHEEHDR